MHIYADAFIHAFIKWWFKAQVTSPHWVGDLQLLRLLCSAVHLTNELALQSLFLSLWCKLHYATLQFSLFLQKHSTFTFQTCEPHSQGFWFLVFIVKWVKMQDGKHWRFKRTWDEPRRVTEQFQQKPSTTQDSLKETQQRPKRGPEGPREVHKRSRRGPIAAQRPREAHLRPKTNRGKPRKCTSLAQKKRKKETERFKKDVAVGKRKDCGNKDETKWNLELGKLHHRPVLQRDEIQNKAINDRVNVMHFLKLLKQFWIHFFLNSAFWIWNQTWFPNLDPKMGLLI